MTVEVGVNRRAGTGQSVTAAVFIVMAAGSIAVIRCLQQTLTVEHSGLRRVFGSFLGPGLSETAICCGGECNVNQGVPSHQ